MKAKGFEFREAVDVRPAGAEGAKSWEVTIFAYGQSKNPMLFPDADGKLKPFPVVYTRRAAEGSVEVFEGAKVYANSQGEMGGHRKDPNTKVPKDIVGVITKVRAADAGLEGNLTFFPSGKWMEENLLFASENGLPMPYQLSIDAGGKVSRNERVLEVDAFHRASVDVVERGAAGGRFVRLAASEMKSQGDGAMKEKLLLIFTFAYPTFLEAQKVDIGSVDENELFSHLMNADKAMPRVHLPDGAQLTESLLDGVITRLRESIQAVKKEKPAPTGDTKAIEARIAEAEKKIEEQNAALRESLLASKIREARLPGFASDLVRDQFKAVKNFTEADVDAAVKKIRDGFAKFVEVGPSDGVSGVRMGMMEGEKIAKGIEAFFMMDPNRPQPEKDAAELVKVYKDVPPFRSIKEAYVLFTGDEEVSGKKSRSARLTESLATADWAEVVASALNKRIVRDYPLLNLDTWRSFVDIVPLRDFKTQRRIRYGGYSNLPTRAEGNPYIPLSSPTDEEATYTPATRGGTEDLTRELILNDDVGAVAKIPQRMARAAAQTLHQFVYDFVCPAVNPTIYDGSVLYVAGHNNTATTALGTDGVALAAARLRMKKQTMKDNSKRLGLRAGLLLVPPDLEKDAYANVVTAYGQYNQVPTFMQSVGIGVIVVDYWTDATDWALVARRDDIVGLEIGFLNGQETPEIFVSDVANVGSWFTNDKITYKIRHEYGGAITDFRAFDGSIVA